MHPLRENVHNSLAVVIHVAKRQIKKSKIILNKIWKCKTSSYVCTPFRKKQIVLKLNEAFTNWEIQQAQQKSKDLKFFEMLGKKYRY